MPLLQGINIKCISQTDSANQKYMLKSFMSITKALELYSYILATISIVVTIL